MGRPGHHRQFSFGSAVTEAAEHSLGAGPEPGHAGNHKAPVACPLCTQFHF